jgi:hypothetical protein
VPTPRSESTRPIAKKPVGSGIRSSGPSSQRPMEDGDQVWRQVVRPAWGPRGKIIHLGRRESSLVRRIGDEVNISKITFGTEVSFSVCNTSLF